MPEFRYAKGMVRESIQYISEEMREFDREYSDKTLKDYQNDKKLQKLMDRTVENVLTALIEVCGTILTEEGIGVGSYTEAVRKSAELFGFPEDGQESLAQLAIQRNRLAHRYLNFRWQAISLFKEQRNSIIKIITCILQKEKTD
jgi:uncharacterized protein YutE (UPF0331/DUF86 family)